MKVFLVLVMLISISNSLKILGIFPIPVLSHFKFFHAILRGLADADHEVTVLSRFANAPEDKDAPAHYKHLLLTNSTINVNSVDLEMFKNPAWSTYIREFWILREMGEKECEVTFNSPALQSILNSKEKYDVILLEQFHNDCMMAIAWKLKAPVIALSSCLIMPWHYDRLGNPLLPSYIPNALIGYSQKMDFLQRFNNWIAVHVLNLMYRYIIVPETDEIIQKHMKNVPSVSELVKETSLIFVNTHHSLSGSRPNAPNVIELGGIHIKEEKPLDAELKKILDSAKDGVIYVSWGSMIRASTLPDDKRISLLKAFGSFKQKILWKFENETLQDQPENVFIRKWLPQRDILCHPNVRVFVSHGGLLGLSEAVYCGVSVVVTPFFGDQLQNAAAVEARGIGHIVRYRDITEETFRTAIINALSPQTLQNAKTVSYSFRNRPMKPIDTAIWWVEHIAATRGAPLLKSHSTNLSAFTYYSFDIYITIATVLTVMMVLSIYIIRSMCRKIIKSKVD